MCAGWIPLHIAEAAIERDHEPPGFCRRSQHGARNTVGSSPPLSPSSSTVCASWSASMKIARNLLEDSRRVDPHADGRVLVVSQLRPMGRSGSNPVSVKGRVLRDDLSLGHPVRTAQMYDGISGTTHASR